MILSPNEVQLINKEFSQLSSYYLNSAYFGPSPLRSKTYVEQALIRELDPSFYPYDEWIKIPDQIREKFSKLLECSPDQISHSTSVSDILNIVANGLKLTNKDCAVSIDQSYPSIVLPWMLASRNDGFQFKLLENKCPDVDWLEKNLPSNTKVFSITHVTFNTGRKVDLKSIGKFLNNRDILFVVDASQSFGGMKISEEELQHIDVLAVASYKWLLGPYGHAFAYFSSRALEKIHHRNGNWIVSPNSKVVHNLLNYTTETLPGARKFDRGQGPNMLTLSCLNGSLEFLLEIGLDKIEKYNHELTQCFLADYPRDKYELVTPSHALSNIVCLKSTSGDPLSLKDALKENNIDISVREGNMRISFHIFNKLNEVKKLIEVINQ